LFHQGKSRFSLGSNLRRREKAVVQAHHGRNLIKEIGGPMKTYLVSVASSLLLVSTLSVEANNIVFGEFSGVLLSWTGGAQYPFTVGDPVTGTFQYDRDLLTGDGSTGYFDPSLEFSVSIDGKGFIRFSQNVEPDGRVIHPVSFSFYVDANGFPSVGNGASLFDVGISPGGDIGFNSWGVYHGFAHVTYSIVGIPDGGATSILLGVALASLAVVRRFTHC
jgi:hypothetical protein